MKLESRYPVSFRLGYRAGRIRGFADGREAGFKIGFSNVQATGQVAMSTEERDAQENADAGSNAGDPEAVLQPSEGGARVAHLLIVSAEHLPSYQIGIRQPLSLLQEQGHCTFEVQSKHDVTDADVAAADIVIVQRSVEPHIYRYFEQAKLLGKRTVYVIDDYYAALPPTDKRGKYFADPGRRKAFSDFLENADIVKVDSPYFEKLLIEKYDSHVVYFPASVNFSWMDRERKKPKSGSALVIGYEGTSKEKDFEPVVPALLRIMKEYGSSIRLEFYGFVPERLENHPSVSFVQAEADYETFIRRLYRSHWDIGIAPLEDTPFNRCKTNNKFREYAACEIPGIYSSSPAYTDWVVHGETGVIVPHSEEGWYEGLKQLIEDRQLRAHIQEQAELAARMHFSVDTCARQWRKKILDG